MRRELTTAEKWAPVDNIIKMINDRKRKGEKPCRTGLEEYVDHTFNKRS